MKIVISLILLCCSMVTMAQNEKGVFSIRPMAGVNLSAFSGGFSEDFYHMKAGLAVGMEAEYGISRSFGLSLGAFYSQMGAKIITGTVLGEHRRGRLSDLLQKIKIHERI